MAVLKLTIAQWISLGAERAGNVSLLGGLCFLLKFRNGRVRNGAVETPADRAGSVEQEDVGVVGRGETGGHLQFSLPVIDQQKAVALLLGCAAF